ncbi:helix-turn-helix transcriptional regulator [Mammaliicoccus sciuri]|uniref:helix-turn-helix transcriptional regulator n=1 Tax=Mammaliicoccus sciuri TaxID=1296 RepID=UPI001E585A17|nr:helix-turn-helix transcriptional regulator [Mammaliicoccus sciuri]
MEKTLLQWHRDVAEQILSIHLNVFNVEDIEDVVKVLATPFDNVKSKKFQRKIYKWIKGLSSKKIYHMINGYGIHFMVMKFHNINEIILFGPFVLKRPSEKECINMLEEQMRSSADLKILKHYLTGISTGHYQQIVRFAKLVGRHVHQQKRNYDVVEVHMDETDQDQIIQQPISKTYLLKELEDRYKLENQMMLAMQYGRVEEVLEINRKLNDKVQGLERLSTKMDNFLYAATLTNTLGRKAIEAAGVDYLMIDDMSKSHARMIANVSDDKERPLLLEEICCNYAKAAQKVRAIQYSAHVKSAVQYIHKYIHTDISLDDICENLGVSTSYLSRLFKQEVGKSVIQYINELRLDLAKDLLIKTNMNVQEIAAYIGFQHTHYFITLFKKVYGQTPLSFRKSLKTENSHN